jgi:hypothetical protein
MERLSVMQLNRHLATLLSAVVVVGCGPISASSVPLPDPGTCVVYVANDVATRMDPVPCSQPHTHIITSTAPRDGCPPGTDTQVATVTEKGMVFCLRSVLDESERPLAT